MSSQSDQSQGHIFLRRRRGPSVSARVLATLGDPCHDTPIAASTTTLGTTQTQQSPSDRGAGGGGRPSTPSEEDNSTPPCASGRRARTSKATAFRPAWARREQRRTPYCNNEAGANGYCCCPVAPGAVEIRKGENCRCENGAIDHPPICLTSHNGSGV